MHHDEADIDADLVRRLLRARFPRWADLPVHRVPSGGTVNALYRLGSDLVVRLPLTAGGAGALQNEVRWLPRLTPLMTVAIPEVVGVGHPAEGFPWPWAVLRWIDGEVAVEGRVAEPALLAADLAAFAVGMRRTTLDGGPPAHRGAPLASVDGETRAAVEALRRTDEDIDHQAALDAWSAASAAPAWHGPPCWTHSDLMPANLLLHGDRLAAVLDFSTAGVGDPAADLVPAWNLLPPAARPVLRHAVDVDDATWARGRGWALSMALVQLPYYRRTNPVVAANARHVIAEVLAE